MKKCPMCAEQIQDEAVKSRHCGTMLVTEGTAPADVGSNVPGDSVGTGTNGPKPATRPCVATAVPSTPKRRILGLSSGRILQVSVVLLAFGLVLTYFPLANGGFVVLGLLTMWAATVMATTGLRSIRIITGFLAAVFLLLPAMLLQVDRPTPVEQTAASRSPSSVPEPATVPAPPTSAPIAFDRAWTVVPTGFNGDDYRTLEAAFPSPKDEFETTAEYEKRLKDRQPSQYVFVEENISGLAKYNADERRFTIHAPLSLGSSGSPQMDGKPTNFRYAMEAGRDIILFEQIEYPVAPKEAILLKEHLGLIWICKPYIGSRPLIVKKATTFQDEVAIDTLLRVDSVTDIWLLDMPARSVLHKFRRAPWMDRNGVQHDWK